MKSIMLLLVSYTYLVNCLPPPHPDVEAVRREEELLPLNLRSTALHNPHLQEILPLTSLLHNGEKLVFDREANNVPRKEIYNILSHAGLIPRKKFRYPPQTHHHPHQQSPIARAQEFYEHSFYEPPRIPTQDYLQHL